MNKARTHYDMFGVPRTASAREIRTAYLQLVKKYHPDGRDASFLDPKRSPLPAINRCYGVLKDPLKRSAYDAQLGRLDRPPIPAVGRRHRKRRLRRLWSCTTLVTAVLMTAAMLPFVPQIEEWWESQSTLTFQGWRIAQPSQTALNRQMPDLPRMRQQVRLATAAPLSQAIRFSQDCLRQAQREDDPSDAQLCVIFDEAALYSRRLRTAGIEKFPYFNVDIVRMRQNAALASFGLESETRLRLLRRQTFQIVVREAETEYERSQVPESS